MHDASHILVDYSVWEPAYKQCFGSGSRSALIWLSWIRIGNADPDLDSGARKFNKE
jgi:hypothetical protein